MADNAPPPEERRGVRTADLVGLAMVFGGAAMVVWLWAPQHAAVADAASAGLRWALGAGSYAIPPVIMVCGVMMLIGREFAGFSRAAAGGVLLTLVLATWLHIALFPTPGPEVPADRLAVVGGYLGAGLANGLVAVVGGSAAPIFLAMFTCVGVLLLTNRAFREVAHALRGPALAAWNALRSAIASVRERGEPDDAEAPEPVRAMIEGEEPPPGWRAWFGWLRRRPAEDAQYEDDDPDALEAGVPELEPEPAARAPRRRPEPAAIEGSADEAQEDDADAADGAEDAEPSDTYVPPPLSLLQDPPPSPPRRAQQELDERVSVVEQTLEQFGIKANVAEIAHGPTVTRYEIQLAPGIKVSKIVSLADNLAMSMAAIDVRVEAPIPGKSAIGLEVPNTTPTLVTMRECLDLPEFQNAAGRLTFALGKDVAGVVRYADLTRMPHLLIGGSTNSGKSVCLNVLIASILYRATPDEVRFIFIDPKRVELSLWDGIPHLLMPVVKDVKKAAGTFKRALREMERRYTLFAAVGTRNIDGYNQRMGEEERLPYIVIVVDELADLMMQCAAEVETSICRLAQLARATGIHLVIATQRPSVDVITGTIKANISSRIAFAVSSQIDSRTILDMSGGERLIGRGDMLFLPIEASKPIRVQGCYLSEAETNALVEYLALQPGPQVDIELPPAGDDAGEGGGGGSGGDSEDPLFEDAVRLVVTSRHASTSMLQRKFKIGYTRAARLLDEMEERGIVGPLDGAKPRDILVHRDRLDDMFLTGYGE